MKNVWDAMADRTRREILLLVKDRPYTAGEICDQFSLSAATVSHHLAVLKEAGLVQVTRRAQTLIYSIRTAPLSEITETVLTLTYEPVPLRRRR